MTKVKLKLKTKNKPSIKGRKGADWLFRKSASVFKPTEKAFINGVLGEDETVGVVDMSLDLEATMDPIEYADLHPIARPAHAYKDILASRETQRKAARIKHDAWLREYGL